MTWNALPQRMLSRCFRLVFGSGWMYRFPKIYDRVIRRRLDAVREEAFDYFLATYARELEGCSVCVDLACGTGLTSVVLATNIPGCRVIGIDRNIPMLREARRRAVSAGVDGSCRFMELDVHELTLDKLKPNLDGRERIDMITCALGFSVIPAWEQAYQQACTLLSPNGLFVIFDDYTPELYLPEFDANQSRRSWELIDGHFSETEVKWFGDMFIAIGRGRVLPK